MRGIRYRTIQVVVEKQVPVPLVWKKTKHFKPVKRKMRQMRIFEKEDREMLRRMLKHEKEIGKLTALDYYKPMLPLREGHTVRFRRYCDLPEVDMQKIMRGE